MSSINSSVDDVRRAVESVERRIKDANVLECLKGLYRSGCISDEDYSNELKKMLESYRYTLGDKK